MAVSLDCLPNRIIILNFRHAPLNRLPSDPSTCRLALKRTLSEWFSTRRSCKIGSRPAGKWLFFPQASFKLDVHTQALAELGESLISLAQSKVSALSQHDSIEQQSGGLLSKLSVLPFAPLEATIAGIVAGVVVCVASLMPETKKREKNKSQKTSDVLEQSHEDWLLIMNPTPFNRFVLMRCPSIVFDEADVYESLAEKLKKEGRHLVSLENEDEKWGGALLSVASGISDALSKGKRRGQSGGEDFPVYQRTYLRTEDDGVVAIDWPSHLDLSGEHGLDTTLLLIPGSADGSGNQEVQSFLRRCLRCGYFPIVLNPRGCGGSPLTTPRLYSAGDSEDLHLAINFVLRLRPWATVMAVGWGYGANMLVKCLGEEGAATPLTAAVCIGNPFDLEESTSSIENSKVPHFNKKMTDGLVQILRSNKMVFEGKHKGFDIHKGLTARSVREFDEAISKVSNGFESLNAFYEDASSRPWLEKVKVPLLCIQDHDYLARTLSIPRHVFEDNPFTTLILSLSEQPESNFNPSPDAPLGGHYEPLIVEWLAGVELAFLKGRHPLLHGIDLTFKPPKDGGLASPQVSESFGRKKTPSVEIQRHGWEPYDPNEDSSLHGWRRENSSDNNPTTRVDRLDNPRALAQIKGLEDTDGDTSDSGKTKPEAESKEDDGDAEEERGQARQATESVLKVLDITMPGTLSEGKKEEVLSAVERGETLVSAFQEACPEEVREKMTAAVSAAVQARGISLKLAGFGKRIPAPKIPDGMIQSIQAKLSTFVPNGVSGDSVVNKDVEEPSLESSLGVQTSLGTPVKHQPRTDTDVKQSDSSESTETKPDSSSLNKEAINGEFADPETSLPPIDLQMKETSNESTASESQKDSEVSGAADSKLSVDGGKTEEEVKSSGKENQEKVVTGKDPDVDSKMGPPPAPTSSQEEEGKRTIGAKPEEGPSLPSVPPPSLDMQRAFEAFTGVDDSTQMAVTNMFGVIEGVIDQLEKEQQHQLKDTSEVGEKQGSSGEMNDPKQEVGPKPSKSFPHGVNTSTNEGSASPSNYRTWEQVGHATEEGANDIQGINHDPPEKQVGDATAKGVGDIQGINHCPQEKQSEKRLAIGAYHEMTEGMAKVQNENEHFEETMQGKRVNEGISQANLASNGTLDAGSESDGGNESDENDLALEYFEDEDVWKISGSHRPRVRDKLSGNKGIEECNEAEPDGLLSSGKRGFDSYMPRVVGESQQVVEPSYIILDDDFKIPLRRRGRADASEKYMENLEIPIKVSVTKNDLHSEIEEKYIVGIEGKARDLVLDALEREMLRRLGDGGIGASEVEMHDEIERIAAVVAEIAGSFYRRRVNLDDLRSQHKHSEDPNVQKSSGKDASHAETIAHAIIAAYHDTAILAKVMPAGVVVGVILAALDPLDLLLSDDAHGSPRKKAVEKKESEEVKGYLRFQSSTGKDLKPMRVPPSLVQRPVESDSHDHMNNPGKLRLLSSNDALADDSAKRKKEQPPPNSQMMDMMAAAMGATAAMASQAGNIISATGSENDSQESAFDHNKTANISSDDESSDNDVKSNIVNSLTEKAISVATPVVPTKQDGGVDHERLVAMLASLGQKGGILRYIGKVALLWGGLRGAMSLTDRLLVFLRISERPLHQRLLGFMVMALLLWSPVLVPLLPSLLLQWGSRSYKGVASSAATVGFYGAVVILIAIWGRKIRGYDTPLSQYGLHLEPHFSPRELQDLVSGLVLGFSMVASFYIIAVAFGFMQYGLAANLSLNASKAALSNIASCGRLMKLALQCVTFNLVICAIKELLYRSWLQEEMAADLGFHKAVVLSGLLFSIMQWSPSSIPGLWFLSLLLTCARVRCNGDLRLAIGLHAGIVASNQLVNLSGQVKYAADVPAWFLGVQVGNPLTGVLGVFMVGLVGLLLYPWDYTWKSKLSSEEVRL